VVTEVVFWKAPTVKSAFVHVKQGDFDGAIVLGDNLLLERLARTDLIV